MIPKECKRLAEVDFPLAVVSKHSAREKSIRHGHPSTLHLWWARRPLASCRAILLALLLPDPVDPHCPADFKETARNLLTRLLGKIGPKDEDLRRALLKFIGDFADWDHAHHPVYLEVGRGLVKAAHGDEPPLVVDPFAGGGSIPLEALRLGCEAFASDLNPVACLILKVMLEDTPRWGKQTLTVQRQNGQEVEVQGLAEALRLVGRDIKEAAEKELAAFYPPDPDGATPIAYLWARTVRCESPNCGAEIPLMRSFWLCKKANRKRALKYKVVRPQGEPPRLEFEVFEPKSDKEVHSGTVTRARATCPCCGAVLPPERVRAQLAAQRGGADVLFDSQGNRIGGARLLAVVTLQPGVGGRHYRLPTPQDYQAVWQAQQRLQEILDEWDRGGRQGLCPVPDEPLPFMSGTFNVPLYGIKLWGDLFSNRQKVALVTLVRLVQEYTYPHLLSQRERGYDSEYPTPSFEETAAEGGMMEAVQRAMAMVINRCVDKWASLVVWNIVGEKTEHVFGRQALPMVWDYCEANPLTEATGGYDGGLNWVTKVIYNWPFSSSGQTQAADATEHPLPDETAHVWFTDPPYYFAVPYADLSDFFFVWLKRALPRHPLLRDPFDSENTLTPKMRELCEMAHWDPERYAQKDKSFFEDGMANAFKEARRILQEEGIGCVIFAHKTTEGWEALLSGLIRAGWTITASWPIATEMASRLRARDSAALATSVHLICRPRPEDAPVGDWAEVLRELPRRVGDWMERLQAEGIRGADLVFACIGPALEIFSRYSRVETAEGRKVTLAEYLEKVWEVVGRIALEQVLGTAEAQARNSAAGALEEDARLTALFLWTLQTTNGNGPPPAKEGEEEEGDEDEEEDTPKGRAKGYSLVFDVVRRFAQPLGIDLPKWEGRIIETKKGVVRLLAVSERAKQLFGQEGAAAAASWWTEAAAPKGQQWLFADLDAGRRRGRKGALTPGPSPRGRGELDAGLMAEATAPAAPATQIGATTLDRVHAAMLLQAGGQANALRALIKAEQDRGPDFLRLANALSALYPTGSEEKRLLDAMLLAVPR